MSLGYIKGKFWHPDERYARYANSDSYKELLRAMRPAGFTFDCQYSYTARRYTAEIVTVEKFAGSGQYYFIKHNNAYHENPMAAVCMAIRANERCTPWVRAACLVIECELLAEAFSAAKGREARLEQTLDALADLLRRLTIVEPLSADPSDVAAADWENIQSGAIEYPEPVPAAPDEDDDL